MSSYVPAWVKTNPDRFPRAEVKGGRRVEALSAFAPANMQADARAFTELMRHVRAVDGRDHTVIMVQVENEVAMIDESADRSAAARAAFAAPVPNPLLARFPGKKPGTWEQVFGRGPATEELFMAWHYALYVEAVARAGKIAYPLPMLTNAALNRPGKKPGEYPTGGPLPHLFDAWKTAAPSLDLLAPDIYYPDFVTWCDRYARAGNPLFIPEAKNEADAPIHALYAFGRGALGFSPFAIESTAEAVAAALTKSYVLLADLAPLIAAAGGKTAGVLIDKGEKTKTFRLGGVDLYVDHDYTFPWAAPALVARSSVRASLARLAWMACSAWPILSRSVASANCRFSASSRMNCCNPVSVSTATRVRLVVILPSWRVCVSSSTETTRPETARVPPTEICAPLQGRQQRGRATSQGRLVERHFPEGLSQRFLARQAEAADAALVVVDDQALQHVVDLIEENCELEGGVALDRRLVLEVAEAARREHHALERKVLGEGRERSHAHNNHHQPAPHVDSPLVTAHHAERRL